jgi:hypothetical protein
MNMDVENPYRAPSAPISGSREQDGKKASSQARSAPGRIYALDCSCGRQISVTAADAGTGVDCDCGKTVRIPSLSKLREISGADPYEAGTIDTIKRMIARGELPAGRLCAISRAQTEDVLACSVIVSREITYQDSFFLRYVLRGGLIGWLCRLGIVFVRVEPAPGSEIEVPTPIRLSARYQAKYRRAGQGRLVRLLKRVPIYAKLLEEYPHARIVAGPASTEG